MDDNFFGRELKLLRLNEKGYGLRKFANHIDMKASDLCKIEQGRVEPPKEEEWLNFIIDKFIIRINMLFY